MYKRSVAEGWGRHLEDELVGISPVVSYVVTHGPIDAPTSWVRGREAPLHVFPSRPALDAFVDGVWFADHVFYLRQVPALRFDTVHGSVTVTDAWEDTKFRTLTDRNGRAAVRVNAPLLLAAQRIDELRSLRPGGHKPVVIANCVGWQPTEALRSRVRLRAWSSACARPDDGSTSGPVIEWVPEPYASGSRAGVWAVSEAFVHVNTDRDVAQAAEAMAHARAKARLVDYVDVAGGITDLEHYANEF